MFLTLIAICVVVLCLLIVIWIKHTRDRHEMELHSITPEALHTLLASNPEVLLFDVRQPLDFLADSEIIVGAKRIPPKELLANPLLIPKEKDSVVYCTWFDDALAMEARTTAMPPICRVNSSCVVSRAALAVVFALLTALPIRLTIRKPNLPEFSFRHSSRKRALKLST